MCKLYLKERAVELLQNNAGQPCFFQYSCHTTPVSSRKYLARQHGNIKVQRTCKSPSDYFVQQMFLCIPSHDNTYLCTILFREPLPLQYGKTMKALLKATRTCPGLSLNGIGSDVITIHHQCHDRAVTFDFIGSLSGWWSKQVAVSEAAAGPPAPVSDNEKLFEWHSWTACAAHDGHNSCKWGHQGLFNDSFLLESCYVGVVAMRICFRSRIESLSGLGSNAAKHLEAYAGGHVLTAHCCPHRLQDCCSDTLSEADAWLKDLEKRIKALQRHLQACSSVYLNPKPYTHKP